MALSEQDRARMGTIDPLFAKAVEENPLPDFSEGADPPDVFVIRSNRASHLAKKRHLYPIPGPIYDTVTESDHNVLARDHYQIPVKIYKPAKAQPGGGPLVIMVHEGGWSMGDLTDEDLNCRMFTRDLGAVSVNVDYRLAPEHSFPTGLNDCHDVVKWCAATARPENDLLPADLSKGFIIGGSSAGGNLSAVTCQLARDEGLQPPLTGQYLCFASLLWSDAVPDQWKTYYRSREESIDDPVLNMKAGAEKLVEEALKPDTTSPLFSPLLHPNLKGLPPTFFQLAGLDPTRDEGLLYERVLREDNQVSTLLKVYDGHSHMFWTNWPLLERSKQFVDDTLEGFRWLLETSQQ